VKRILTIAGSDSGGGAGIQADLKTITVLGGYGMSAITALTAQNTVGVRGVYPVPVDFIRLQMETVLSDIGADAAKTGMLATPEIVTAVAAELKRFKVELLVVDPVMVAKSGDALLSEAAKETLKEILLPMAYLVTPNLPEASVLCRFAVNNTETMKAAAKIIHGLGPRYVLIKGGHLEKQPVDVLFDGKGFERYEAPRVSSKNTHGTGCTYSAALATLLAQGLSVHEAVSQAKKFITRAIRQGLTIGSGHGPTNHYAHVALCKEKEEALRMTEKALEKLTNEPLGFFIPEVRSNLGYALPGAMNYEEIVAVPGRISQIGEKIIACRLPAFGASRHIARVIMAAMAHDPEMRSAMNIKYSPEILDACRAAGLGMASFDRREEPPEVKQKEGSSLEWGTENALQRASQFPDLVCDEGDVGKEPMIRVLGGNPMEVVDKVIRVAKAAGWLSDKDPQNTSAS
jgi:hydroxymethylpyrimidine kinase / phosphomethylpyrimidine kinase / thiamine-phosphate diphosphorylase